MLIAKNPNFTEFKRPFGETAVGPRMTKPLCFRTCYNALYYKLQRFGSFYNMGCTLTNRLLWLNYLFL
jgi:hypothetical protein